MTATPIFDLIATPPKVPLRRTWIAYLIAGLVGAVLGISPNLHLRYFTGFNGLLILPALYVATAIHELGHLIAGRIVGMRPGAIMIAGVVIFKSGAHWGMRFDHRCMFSGGFAKLLPQKEDLRPSSFGWAIAGGAIASLMFTLVCGLVALRYGNGFWGWIATLFWSALLITVLPLFQFSRRTSDGARLWQMMRRPDQTPPWMALWALESEETCGVLPRNWDPELVRQMLVADPTSGQYPHIQLLAFYRLADEKNEQVALEHLENALAKSASSSKILRQCIFLEAALSSALWRKNVSQARTWLARAGQVREPLSTYGVEAAIAICEKRYDDAVRLLNKAGVRIERRKLDSGLARFAKEKLAECKELCANAQRETTPLMRD